MILQKAERRVVCQLWERGPQSRTQLAHTMGLRPNAVGRIAADLISRGLLREGQPAVSTGGRPRVPLQIDPDRRRVIGLTLEPQRVMCATMNLHGQVVGRIASSEVCPPEDPVRLAASMLSQALDSNVMIIGVSATGFIDTEQRRLLLSSAAPGHQSADLDALYDAAGDVPIVLQNNMHAMAAQWVLGRRLGDKQDTILVRLDDGSIGAALIIGGRPNRGSVIGANELGHMRLPLETERCYCGGIGCAERLFSTAHLQRLDPGSNFTLPQRAARLNGDDRALEQIMQLTATSIANVVNFVRPHRLVLVSALVRHANFADRMVAMVRSQVLEVLVERLRIERWDQAEIDRAEAAGWLALAELYYNGWRTGRRTNNRPTEPVVPL